MYNFYFTMDVACVTLQVFCIRSYVAGKFLRSILLIWITIFIAFFIDWIDSFASYVYGCECKFYYFGILSLMSEKLSLKKVIKSIKSKRN